MLMFFWVHKRFVFATYKKVICEKITTIFFEIGIFNNKNEIKIFHV